MSEAVSGVEIQKMDVSLKAIRVGSRQMTKNIFSQLPALDVLNYGQGETLQGDVWGWVNYWPEQTKKKPYVWECDGVLYRALLPWVDEWEGSVEFDNFNIAETEACKVLEATKPNRPPIKYSILKHMEHFMYSQLKREGLLISNFVYIEPRIVYPEYDRDTVTWTQENEKKKVIEKEYTEWFDANVQRLTRLTENAYKASRRRLAEENIDYGLSELKRLHQIIEDKGQLFICT